MTEKTEYAIQQEEKHKRRIILPCVIPWEAGTNKYASQKGSSGFGTIRNTTLKVNSSKQLSESSDGVVPLLSVMATAGASQAGQTPFGQCREHVTRVKPKNSKEKIQIDKLEDRMTITMLNKWSRPNNQAKNSDIGRRRDAVSESVGGRRFTHEELIKSRAAIPKFQDPRNSIAALNARAGDSLVTGYHNHRQATMSINGLDRTEQDQLDTNRYMAWLGGQLTLQSQSRTGGFQKPRDVVSTSYYDRLMSEREVSAKELRRRLETEKAKQNEKENQENDPVDKDEE